MREPPEQWHEAYSAALKFVGKGYLIVEIMRRGMLNSINVWKNRRKRHGVFTARIVMQSSSHFNIIYS